MNRLVLFYSFEGNTGEAARRVAKLCKADLCEVRPVKDIPISGPGKFLEGGFKAMFGVGAGILPPEKDVTSYDEIIIGTPIWAGFPSPYVINALRDDEVKKKVIAVFTLSGSGNNHKCVKSLRKRFPNIRQEVSLFDRVGKKSADNKRKIEAFVKELYGSEK